MVLGVRRACGERGARCCSSGASNAPLFGHEHWGRAISATAIEEFLGNRMVWTLEFVDIVIPSPSGGQSRATTSWEASLEGPPCSSGWLA
jgi:hypothetical protein